MEKQRNSARGTAGFGGWASGDGPFPEYNEAIREYYAKELGRNVDIGTLSREDVARSGFFSSQTFQKDVMAGAPGEYRVKPQLRITPDTGYAVKSLLADIGAEEAAKERAAQTQGSGPMFPNLLQNTTPRHTPTDPYGARFERLPDPPAAIPEFMPLTRPQELAIKEGFADRKTLPQYQQVTSGVALNAGHNNGVEIRDLKANREILVYVKNINALPAGIEIKAGPSLFTCETIPTLLAPLSEKIFRFKNNYSLMQYFAINSVADSYGIEYKVFSRGHYAKY